MSHIPSDAGFRQVFPQVSVEEQHLIRGVGVLENGAILASCCIYENPFISYNDRSVLIIGDFFSLEDAQASAMLLNACMSLAKSSGADYIVGPMSGSTWEDYRFALEGQAPRFFTEPEQPEYYARLWVDSGFIPVAGYYSSEASLSGIPAQWAEFETQLNEAGIKVADATQVNWQHSLESLYPLCSAAFSNAPFYSPISKEHFIEKYTAIQKVWQPELILVANDAAGQPLAFILALPNHLDASGESCILKTIARQPEATIEGLIPYMGYKLYHIAASLGYKRIIHAFMHEANRSLLRSGQAGGSVIRRYALFAKKITA